MDPYELILVIGSKPQNPAKLGKRNYIYYEGEYLGIFEKPLHMG